MKARVVIECGAAETRAAFIVGDEVIRYWFGPARGDENLSRPPQTGDAFFGRIRSVSKSLNSAFVDIGAARDGFLPFGKNEKPPAEGALIRVTVRRPEIGAKGAVLAAKTDPALPSDRPPGPIGEPVDAAIAGATGAALRADARARDIIINDVAAAKALREYGFDSASVEDDPFATSGAEETLAAALEREVRLPGGARLAFDETDGPAVIDVDAGPAADGATGRLSDKVNLAAAKALPGELSRRALGGRVVIDFLPPSGAPARHALVEAFKRACGGLIEARIGRLSADGLFDLTMPCDDYSLLERATEPVAGDLVRPGRRLTLDWRAKAAVRALERALRQAPSARPRLVVGASIDVYLKNRPQWRERIAAKFGARFQIEASATIEERSFDVAI